jgi:hypothetical protein
MLQLGPLDRDPAAQRYAGNRDYFFRSMILMISAWGGLRVSF